MRTCTFPECDCSTENNGHHECTKPKETATNGLEKPAGEYCGFWPQCRSPGFLNYHRCDARPCVNNP